MTIKEEITKTLESYVESHGYDEQKIIDAENGFECLTEELAAIFSNRLEKLVMPKIAEDYGETFKRKGEYAIKLHFYENTDEITLEELYQRFKNRILLEELNR